MQIGLNVIFQNPGNARPDEEVYRNEVRLAELAEPLGFDSIWGTEHHFSDYIISPDLMMLLTYFAARTEKIQLGSMVVVLPWHNPMRVAEQISLLDHLSGGRLLLGVGRGLGRIEFDGFKTPMEHSREIFIESARMLIQGLEQGYCEYEGKFVKQPRRDIRPFPFKSFKGRTYAAAMSPESARIMAELGLGVLIIPQKPWPDVAKELAEYRRIYREVNGGEAPPVKCAGWVFCDEDAGRAGEMAQRYIGDYYQSVVRHYELKGQHLSGVKGYEHYRSMQERINRADGVDAMTQFYIDLQVWGTPDQCYEKVMEINRIVGHDTFMATCSYGGMPYDEAERNLRLFASKVMPRLQQQEGKK